MKIAIEELKPILKEKWLNYYQFNRQWLEKIDGYGHTIKDPWFILGIVTALEPKPELKELLQYFILVTKDCHSITEALGIDFDPKEELKKRQAESTEKQIKIDTENLDRIREEIKT